MKKIAPTLLFFSFNIMYSGQFPEHPAVHAARVGEAEQLQEQLDLGVNPDMADQVGTTLLLYGINAGRLHIVQIVLDAGADPVLGDNDAADTQLERAESYEYDEIANLVRQYIAMREDE